MALAFPISEIKIGYLRFVDCCTGLEILFRGVLPASIPDGSVVSYIGAPFPGFGGSLQTNNCYTLYEEITSDPIAYPVAPGSLEAVLEIAGPTGCDDPICAPCTPVLPCNCPDGFTQVGVDCVGTVTTAASYTGDTFIINQAENSQQYCSQGLRLYPNITSLIWPLKGDGILNAVYSVQQNNGIGAVVNPIGNVQSEVWGKGTVPCFTGTNGGRLNIAGVWPGGYPNNEYLEFEYCVTNTDTTNKEYLIGIAADNIAKIYIDTVEAVFLDAPNTGVTIPSRYWHVFPISLSPGVHTIKVAGLNSGGTAAFAAEIYDITLSQFQASLMTPATGIGNCGTSPLDLEPYILFSTRNLVNYEVADPNSEGHWFCNEGDPEYCNGVPTCSVTQSFPLSCDCYLIVPCGNRVKPFVTNNPLFEDYIGQFNQVDSSVYTGCAYIIKLDNNNCGETIIDATPGELSCDCDLRCYYVYNTNGFLYVDSDNNLQEVSSLEAKPYVKICSKIYPIEENSSVDYAIEDLGLCEEGECPVQCFKLTNCENPNSVIYTNSTSLLPYIFGTNNIVRILNREGCWIASTLDPDEVCDCPIDITVTTSYASCPDCIGYKAYKLRSCEGNDVIYTLFNLEAYIGQVVKLDCGCYTVEQINYLPPNPQVIKLEDVYTDCTECLRKYYKLTDCTGVADPIITYTDLLLNLRQVIKIDGCEGCWIVEQTTEHLNATTVVVTETYTDCNTCGIDLPCICTTVSNYGEVVRTYGFIDCDKLYQEITVNPGETSPRVCASKWYPVDYCSCFIVKITIVDISTSYTANIIPDEILNGFPVYSLCVGEDCGTVSFNGDNWIIYDYNNSPVYILDTQTSGNCPIGNWIPVEGPEPEDTTIESLDCPNACRCVELSIIDGGNVINQISFSFDYYDSNGYPVYNNSSRIYNISFDIGLGCWVMTLNDQIFQLCNDPLLYCPAGTWVPEEPTSLIYVSSNCIPDPEQQDFLLTDYFQTYGECQQGVCLPANFKNNRSVRPGYNTPNCNPDEYDKITCRFADAMYKVALEKRYGITNCCQDDDEKWIFKKELIDLQALKDPHYDCPDCLCSCNSGKTHSTCNCGN